MGTGDGNMAKILPWPGRRPATAGPGKPRPGAPGTDPLLELAEKARAGDRAAAEALLRALGPSLLRVVRGVLGPTHPDLEDVVQDAMIRFLKALEGFRGESGIRHFAARIAVRTAADHGRKAYSRRNLAAALAERPDPVAAGGSVPPGIHPESVQRQAVLQLLLEELSEVQAEALVLRSVLECSLEEIASATGAPLNTVRSRLRLAKDALKRRLETEPELRDLLLAGTFGDTPEGGRA